MKTITARTAGHTYPIVVGADLSERLNRLLQQQVGVARLFVFFDANFYALHGAAVRDRIKQPTQRVSEFVVPSGEKAKSLRVLRGIHDFLLSEKITRDDFILACGGGVTSDLVGFAAATVLRGVRWGVLPTTLLGMVDAAIGGKTGINHARGKNLIGAFWQPEFVCSDIRFLATLPARQVVAGLGEVLKTAGLIGEKPVADLGQYLDCGKLYDERLIAGLVRGSAAYKAGIVERDEREAGSRMVLNFGHTFAHGIERALGYGRLLHGEAVILGIDAALKLGERLDMRSAGLQAYRHLVGQLMRRIPRRKLVLQPILDAMALDKKRSATDQRYVMLNRLGQPVIRDQVDRRLVRSSLADTLERYRELGGRDV